MGKYKQRTSLHFNCSHSDQPIKDLVSFLTEGFLSNLILQDLLKISLQHAVWLQQMLHAIITLYPFKTPLCIDTLKYQ